MTNVGLIDRLLRVVVGCVLLGLTMFGKIGYWGWIGVIPLATGAVGTCPLYSLIGIGTGKIKEALPSDSRDTVART